MEANECSVPMKTAFQVPARVNRETKPDGTIVSVKGTELGGNGIVIIAGPCAVESNEQLFATARSVCTSGAKFLRGGAFKPRSSPYSFQGMGEEGLKLLREISNETGQPVVTEVMDRACIRICRHSSDRFTEYAELPAFERSRNEQQTNPA
jgi:3-deoxy-7-phosphoheptulonate synthase